MSILIGIHFYGLASNELFINQSSNLWKSRFKPFFYDFNIVCTWWRHQMETFSALPGYCFLCGEFIVHRWIPRTKASDAELWCFPSSLPEKKKLSKQASGWWFETPSHLLWHHCNQIRLTKGTQASIYPRGTRTTFQYLTSRFWHHIYWHVGNYVVYYTKVYKRAVKHHRQNVWLSR